MSWKELTSRSNKESEKRNVLGRTRLSNGKHVGIFYFLRFHMMKTTKVTMVKISLEEAYLRTGVKQVD